MDLNELKTRLQQHFSDGLVTIIGSGLSCAEGLPGMGELATHLCEQLGAALINKELEEWKLLIPKIQKVGLEAALLENTPSLGLEQSIAKTTGQFISDREQLIFEEVFTGKRRLRLSYLIPHLIKPSTGLPFVTTNYDRLVELAIEEAGISVDTMFIGHYSGSLNERESKFSFCRNVTLKDKRAIFEFKSRAIVYKPHGSLDWYLRDGKPVFHAGTLTEAVRLIITPGHNKFRNGYESPFDHHRNRGNDAIDRASRYLILGYGFNDDHLETHLTPAIQGGKPTLLITRSLSVKAKLLANSYENVIAIEHGTENQNDGSNIIINKTSFFIPLNFWDIGEFIKEVLEP